MSRLSPIPIHPTDPADWEAAADPRRRIGARVEFHPVIGSTNDRARELLRAGDSGVAVVADVQTAGRGRQGRTWISPPGANLMVSIGLRPRLSAADAWWLGAATALAIRDAVSPDAALGVRWPNDLVSSTGAKVAGLLVETSLDGDAIEEAVLGMGVNVNWPRSAMPDEIRARATSLLELAGGSVDRVALLGRLLAALDDELDRIEIGESPIERFRAASVLAGQPVRVDLGERSLTGHAIDIDEDGSLLIEHDGTLSSVAYGEVVRLHAPAEARA